jgi:hypothetical protein
MAVKTKSIFKPAEENDGIRILITRYYPRGIKTGHFDYWIKLCHQALLCYKATNKEDTTGKPSSPHSYGNYGIISTVWKRYTP